MIPPQVPQSPSTSSNSADEHSPLLARGLKQHTIYVYLVACVSAIGGFLFGYDTGIISGAMIFIRDVFQLNEWWQEAIVSSTLLAAWLFSILSGSATNRLGRKRVIIFSSLVFVVGSLLMAFAWDEKVLLAGRLVVGAGVGLTSMTVPMYIAEVAPSSIRGQLVMINMCCITGGQFLASVVAYVLASYLDGSRAWRYMLGLAALPAALQFAAFLAMPESPRWLVAKGRYQEARTVLAKIRPAGADIDSEFNAIKENDLASKRQQQALADPQQSTLKRIMRNPPVRKALLIGCLLQMIQQVSGINTVMYYMASIFEMSGVYSKPRALLLSSFTSMVNFVFTLVGYQLVERVGRRRLTLYSLSGVILSLTVLAAGFQFAYVNSPPVTKVDNSPANKPCDLARDCSACSLMSQCGFCFTLTGAGGNSSIEPSNTSEALCLHVDPGDHGRSSLGGCSTGSSSTGGRAQHIWAFEWCPSAYSWVTMIGLVMYLLFFAPGMGPMPWTINSELYPSWARSWCLSASTSTNWLFNLLISMTFLSLTRAITKHGAFYLYAVLSLAGFLYFALVLPETKGRTLEEMDNLFDGRDNDADCRERNKTNKGEEQF